MAEVVGDRGKGDGRRRRCPRASAASADKALKWLRPRLALTTKLKREMTQVIGSLLIQLAPSCNMRADTGHGFTWVLSLCIVQ